MREWSHHEKIIKIFARGHGARRAHGHRILGRVPNAVGLDRLDCREDRMHTETLRRWVHRHECDLGQREGVSTAEQERVKALEREVREFRKSSEIQRLASAFFAQAELDRRFKT